jgi:hypothetical protein
MSFDQFVESLGALAESYYNTDYTKLYPEVDCSKKTVEEKR